MVHIIETTSRSPFASPKPPAITQAKALRKAKISEFRAPTPKILFGERLQDIIDLEASIAAHGLVKPLKVTRAGDKLVVIDGRKRLAALRRMHFKNTLPRRLEAIPFVMATEPIPHAQHAPQNYSNLTKPVNEVPKLAA